MGLGAFLWVPLTLALGRRPVFLIASLMMLFACLAASVAKTFYQLLLCVSLLGLAEGFALSVVSASLAIEPWNGADPNRAFSSSLISPSFTSAVVLSQWFGLL
jgi:predicted MFS family arabinose efflux permease